MKAPRRLQFFLVAFVSSFSALVYWHLQPQIIAGEGKGWDGLSYYEMYNSFAGSPHSTNVLYPFCKRIGLPYLAASLPIDPTQSFLYINLTLGFLSILITYLALRVRFTFAISFITILPLVFYISSPIRFPNFYPYTVDPPAIFLYSTTLLALVHRKYWLSLVLLIISVVFRESGMYFAIILIASLYFTKEIKTKIMIFQTLLTVSAALILSLTYFGECSGNQLKVVLASALMASGSFLAFLKIFAALSLTLAPFVLVNQKFSLQKIGDLNLVAFSFLLLSTAMGALGGSDTTRIFYVSFPLYAFFLANLIKESAMSKVLFFALGGMIANSFARRIPEPEQYLPNNDVTGLFSLFPDHGHIAISSAIITFWIIYVFIAERIDWKHIDKLLIRNFFVKLKNKFQEGQ